MKTFKYYVKNNEEYWNKKLFNMFTIKRIKDYGWIEKLIYFFMGIAVCRIIEHLLFNF
jgi:hypothetical protein